MIRPGSVNRSTFALLVVCAVLAVIIAIELAYPARTGETGVAAAEPARIPLTFRRAWTIWRRCWTDRCSTPIVECRYSPNRPQLLSL